MHNFVILLSTFSVEVELVPYDNHPMLFKAFSLSFQETVSLMLINWLVFIISKPLENLMRWSSRPLRLFCVHSYHASFTTQGNVRRVADHPAVIHPL